MKSSRISGFYKKSVEERKEIINNIYEFTDVQYETLTSKSPLSLETADKMIENVVGTFQLPFGLGLNFLVNGKEYIVPMVIEEASVVASASHIAKIVRDAGGFVSESTERVMIGQIQVVGCNDFQKAKEAVLHNKEVLIQAANDAYPSILARGGSAQD